MFPTADPHTDPHTDKHTLHTPHTHGGWKHGLHAVQIRHHTHTQGVPGVAKQGEKPKRRGGAETQGYKAQAQGPKGGFGYTHPLEVIITISMI